MGHREDGPFFQYALEAVFQRREAAILDRLDVGADGGVDAGLAVHEILYELGFAAGKTPSRSCITSTWPEQSGPAPMPMVGIVSSSVTSLPSFAGIASSTTIDAPAACKASASAFSWSALSMVLP